MSACASMACNACPNPGRCCTGFSLNGDPRNRSWQNIAPAARATPLGVLIWLASVLTARHDGVPQLGLPFMPLMAWSAEASGEDGHPAAWRLWCPLLGADGRCTDYARRPQVCAIFEPGSGPLCALHREPAPVP